MHIRAVIVVHLLNTLHDHVLQQILVLELLLVL